MRETESRSATALSYKLQRRRKILNAGRDAVLILIRSLTVDVMIIIDKLLIIEYQRHTLFQKERPIHLQLSTQAFLGELVHISSLSSPKTTCVAG